MWCHFFAHCEENGQNIIVFVSPQDDQTALHISSRLGKADIVQQLLQRGASANAATTSGYTPLHLAAREGHEDVAAMLLDQGASLSASTKVCVIGLGSNQKIKSKHSQITVQPWWLWFSQLMISRVRLRTVWIEHFYH